MTKDFTRQELYDLVWSTPISRLASEIGVSGVAIAKACDRAHVPVPPRGWWARQAHGKPGVRTALPKRPPGLEDRIRIGGGPYWRYYAPQITEDELLGPIPPEPIFEDSLDEVQRLIESAVRKVIVPKTLDHPHPAVARILKHDEARAEKQRQSSYVSSWYAPRYDTPLQRRRLRLASALFVALAAYGARAELSGGEPFDGHANDFSVRVGDQHVSVRIAVIETKRRTGKGAEAKTTTDHRIRITLDAGGERSADGRSWEDGDARLESQLGKIAVAIVVKGEEQHRESVLRTHRWRIQRREELIERRRREREEAERLERERIAELERRRVERLLGEAEALRRAEEIRRYVTRAREANAELQDPMPLAELDAWSKWALAQAERIDPIRSGAFRRSREDHDLLSE